MHTWNSHWIFGPFVRTTDFYVIFKTLHNLVSGNLEFKPVVLHNLVLAFQYLFNVPASIKEASREEVGFRATQEYGEPSG